MLLPSVTTKPTKPYHNLTTMDMLQAKINSMLNMGQELSHVITRADSCLYFACT
jgi:hypothetical protein